MAQSLRPLLVATAYPPSLGGAQLHAHQLVTALDRAGHRPAVATIWRRSRSDWLRGTTVAADVGPRTSERLDGVDVHQLGITSRARGAVVAGAFYPALLTGLADTAVRRLASGLFEASLEEVIEQVRPDVVHLSRIGRVHPYLAAVAAARRRGLPIVLTPNHHEGWVRRRDRWWWDLYRQADAVLALTNAEVGMLEAGGVDRARIHRTSVGVVGAPVASQPGGGPTVAFVGQAHPYKGIDVLAAAWPRVRAAVPEARLEVVGPWPRGGRRLRGRLAALPGVVVHGPVSDDDKWAALARADVLAVPSSGESLGGVYLEAWAAGAVPVGADIPPVAELLDGAGRVTPRTPDALADIVVELLSDARLRAALVAAGRERLARDHAWERIAANTVEVYRQVVAA